MLDKAVIGLLDTSNHGSVFLTTIYCSLRFCWTTRLPTACTNGLTLEINPDWYATLSERMRVTLLAHELWHIAYMHIARVGNRNFQIFNMAADHAINLMLIDNGYWFDKDPMTGEIIGLADPQYRGMTAEQIYDKLIESGSGVNLPFGIDFSTRQDDEEELTPEQQNEILATIVKAATLNQMSGSGAGNLPADFVSMMDALLRPRLKWGTLLDRWLTERSEEGYTWQRPNRRYQDVYLPSKAGQAGLARLLYAIDCSGSLTDPQLLVINSELKGLKERFLPESMQIVSFDTKIQDRWEFSNDDDLTRLTIHGRGGTNMKEVFALADKDKPQALIMFSDMDCEIPPKPNGVDVLWICLDNPEWLPPYGKAIHIDSRRDL